VLAAVAGQFVMVGAFDIILVVIASEHDELGKGGAGVLTACFGAGAFLSMSVAGRVARRPRLAPLILLLLALMSVVSMVFGIAAGVVAAVVSLPILGASRSLLDLMSRVLLQRSAPPSELADVFGALEAACGLGLLLGSLMAQVLIASWGASAALYGVAVMFALLALALVRPLRTVDDGADVPVVAMSLLRRMPVFAPLPVLALEAVARSAVELPVRAGVEVIRQGEPGDRFYAVADGSFDVTMSGAHMRTIERGGSFGEVALLADVPRTATVTATRPGHLLAIDRDPFLLAVTGYEPAHVAARAVIGGMTFDGDAPLIGGSAPSAASE
jgi:MFS family permease